MLDGRSEKIESHERLGPRSLLRPSLATLDSSKIEVIQDAVMSLVTITVSLDADHDVVNAYIAVCNLLFRHDLKPA
jgi:hypothetical protein